MCDALSITGQSSRTTFAAFLKHKKGSVNFLNTAPTDAKIVEYSNQLAIYLKAHDAMWTLVFHEILDKNFEDCAAQPAQHAWMKDKNKWSCALKMWCEFEALGPNEQCFDPRQYASNYEKGGAPSSRGTKSGEKENRAALKPSIGDTRRKLMRQIYASMGFACSSDPKIDGDIVFTDEIRLGYVVSDIGTTHIENFRFNNKQCWKKAMDGIYAPDTPLKVGKANQTRLWSTLGDQSVDTMVLMARTFLTHLKEADWQALLTAIKIDESQTDLTYLDVHKAVLTWVLGVANQPA
jgi:hypothetical protein